MRLCALGQNCGESVSESNFQSQLWNENAPGMHNLPVPSGRKHWQKIAVRKMIQTDWEFKIYSQGTSGKVCYTIPLLRNASWGLILHFISPPLFIMLLESMGQPPMTTQAMHSSRRHHIHKRQSFRVLVNCAPKHKSVHTRGLWMSLL